MKHRRRLLVPCCLVSCLICLVPGPALGQIPEIFTNLRVLPEDIERDQLLNVMRDFSFALDVRCQYCHAGGDGVSFEGVDFSSDEDPDKRKARFMMRMTENMNLQVLPLLPARDKPTVTIECKTCHRSRPRPLLLKQELELALDRDGPAAAVALYHELREEYSGRGAFDFGEWEVNTLAESLADASRTADAIAIYELNLEAFPDSSAIHLNLGKLYEESGDAARARRHYERVLELRPNHRGARERLEALGPS